MENLTLLVNIDTLYVQIVHMYIRGDGKGNLRNIIFRNVNTKKSIFIIQF